MPPISYCIDTCSVIDAWTNYPITHFEDLWAALEYLIGAGRLFAPMEVHTELKKAADDCFEWADRQDRLFAEVDGPQQRELQRVNERFPDLSDQAERTSLADPWVVALALHKGSRVVT